VIIRSNGRKRRESHIETTSRKTPFTNLPYSEFVPPIGGGDVPRIDADAVDAILRAVAEIDEDVARHASDVLAEFTIGARQIPEEAMAKVSTALLRAAGGAPDTELADAAATLDEALDAAGWKTSDREDRV